MDVPSPDIESHQLKLRRLELEYELAQTGLKGTLIAVLAVILMVTVLVAVGSFTKVTVLSGLQLVSLFTILAAAALGYGAFVYKRLVKVFGKFEAGGSSDRSQA